MKNKIQIMVDSCATEAANTIKLQLPTHKNQPQLGNYSAPVVLHRLLTQKTLTRCESASCMNGWSPYATTMKASAPYPPVQDARAP